MHIKQVEVLTLLAILKHVTIPFLEFQVVNKTPDKITLQNVYSGKIETLGYNEVSSDYYYIYNSDRKLFNK